MGQSLLLSKELQSIIAVHENRSRNSKFKNYVPYFYWSSTTDALDSVDARVVHLGMGDDRKKDKDDYNFIMCVRNHQL
jgi:hypothetical protein